MKSVKFLLAVIVLVVASVCELSAQTSSSASQTVTFGVRRIVPAFLASMQLTASSINDSHMVQSKAVKMTVGSETRSRQFASDDQSSDLVSRSSLASLKAPRLKSNKLVITVTE
jgi:hypothetical protein